MLKNIVRLDEKVNNKDYTLICDNDSPLPDVKEALFQMLKYVGQLEDAAKAIQVTEAPKEEEKVIEDGNQLEHSGSISC
jgi:hypothetical protein